RGRKQQKRFTIYTHDFYSERGQDGRTPRSPVLGERYAKQKTGAAPVKRRPCHCTRPAPQVQGKTAFTERFFQPFSAALLRG
ncbi:MAG: hypothetical protein IKS14_02205, partial [Thermoguttaceae bacterium]|nr:hypothetical protein [Thermoguttaceae bacterium]